LGIELKKVHVKNFIDGEFDIRIKNSVRGKDVFLIQV
jgi:phosphoribosylpyrophosphate synthetase